MYVEKVKEHPAFNNLVNKSVNHLHDNASVDSLKLKTF